jgi:hypothetical protein
VLPNPLGLSPETRPCRAVALAKAGCWRATGLRSDGRWCYHSRVQNEKQNARNWRPTRPRGKTAAKELGWVAAFADSQSDKASKALSLRSLHLLRKAIRIVNEALPDTDPTLIGGYFANLLDLWETGQELDKKLKEICTFRLPRDRERLRSALLWIEAIQLDLASYWIGEVKKDTPKLLKALDKLKRKRNAAKRKRKLANARPARKRKPGMAHPLRSEERSH